MPVNFVNPKSQLMRDGGLEQGRKAALEERGAGGCCEARSRAELLLFDTIGAYAGRSSKASRIPRSGWQFLTGIAQVQ
jgi:hypothetical protein